MRYHRRHGRRPPVVHDASGPQGVALREAKRALRAKRAGRARRVARATHGRRVRRDRRAHAVARADFLAARSGARDASLSQRMGHPRPGARRALRRQDRRGSARRRRRRECSSSTRSPIPQRDVGLSRQGIPEPLSHCPPIARDAIDFVVVPGVAFDREGRPPGLRRRLSTIGCCRFCRRAPRASPARSTSRSSPQVPVGPNDIAIDAIVTESRELSVPR